MSELKAFSLSTGTTAVTLKSLIDGRVSAGAADVTSYRWGTFAVHNKHASQTLTFITHSNDHTAPTVEEGIVVAAGETVALDVNRRGIINGQNMWVDASGASTTFDLMVVPSGD